jgi:tRNA 5-methylaminomethyl-2-thiouridine biosynthesis bifunctional protein
MNETQKGPLHLAQIIYQQGAAFHSTRFDDIYFSPEDGLAETRHVFIDGNDLPNRFAALGDGDFTIGELGFGTGLNFLTAWQAFEENQQNQSGHLHFISVEGFPLSADDFTHAMQAIAQRWPEFAHKVERLQKLYPPHAPGLHLIPVAKNITLHLWFAPVDIALGQMSGTVDAWFFDGFSPAKNPEMWTQGVFDAAASLSQKGTSLATFSAAGHVRDKLENAGFAWQKTKGFGRKKHMLQANLQQSPQPLQNRQPWFAPPPPSPTGRKRIAIIGAGIAGACLARHLRGRHDVTVFDPLGAGGGASGNPAGLLLPRMDADETPEADFYRQSWLYALQFYRELEQESGKTLLDDKGGLRLGLDERQRRRLEIISSIAALPQTHMRKGQFTNKSSCGATWNSKPQPRGATAAPAPMRRARWAAHSAEQPASVKGKQALHFLQGGVIAPLALTQTLLADSPVRKETVQSISKGKQGWHLITDKTAYEFDCIILANGPAARKFVLAPETMPDPLELSSSVGQIEILESSPKFPEGINAIMAGHYILQWQDQHYMGASYEPLTNDSDLEWQEQRAAKTLSAIAPLFPNEKIALAKGKGRVSVRASATDYHPMAGALPDWEKYQKAYRGINKGADHVLRQNAPDAQYHEGLYVLTGLSSRGFSSAPLLSAMIAALINNTPAPMAMSQINLVHPARQIIRTLKRQI